MKKTKNNRDEIYNDALIKADVKSLEQFYVNGKIENLPQIVENKKEQIVKDILDYKMLYTEEKKNDKGEVTSTKLHITPYIVSNYFFRSINGLNNIEPEYSGEHLSILWNLYTYMVEQVNIHLTPFTPNITHFCKFIGITSSSLKRMLKSPDDGIRITVEKIYDVCYDERMTMAELDKYNARATTFRMKSEMNINEKDVPQVVINTQSIDFDSISKRLSELSKFDDKVKEAQIVSKSIKGAKNNGRK